VGLPLPAFIALCIIVLAFMGIIVADIVYGIIPDLLVLTSMVASFLYLYFTNQMLTSHILTGLFTLLFFVFLFLITKGRGMGLGDVKLSFVLGLFLGFPNIIIALYLAFLTGALVSIILVIWRKVSFSKGTIPFGPFLVLSTLLAFFIGEKAFYFLLQIL